MPAINPIDAEILEGTKDKPVDFDETAAEQAGQADEDEEEYRTLSSPWKYLAFLVLFVVAHVGAYVYFYRGGRDKLRRKLEDMRYEKLPTAA